jgi:hypothetical protein
MVWGRGIQEGREKRRGVIHCWNLFPSLEIKLLFRIEFENLH